jgi:dienelactone hydrolase
MMTRREAILAGVTTAVGAAGTAAAPATVATRSGPLLFANDPQFWFETKRVFGAADYGGAQFGEVLAISQAIAPGDYESWYTQWNALAERLASEADGQASRKHRVSARDNWLRASNYFRSSEFFLHENPKDPRIANAYRRSVDCYRRAIERFDGAIEPVEIPYEGTTLPGYFHHAAGSGKRLPTLIAHTGFDGSAEEMHFIAARAAIERGYNVLVFDGPGQFGPLHRAGMVFRPDWEAVITPVVDFAVARKDVDPQRVALMGMSLGGLLAPRAAAFERRLVACIANDGVYDFGAPFLATVPADQREAFTAAVRAPQAPEIDRALEQAMAASPTARWALTHGMYAMGAPTPRAYVAMTLQYNLRDGVAESIGCPTLVTDAENDLFFKGQPDELYEHLTCPKAMLRFTEAEGAGAHCEVGASRLALGRIYDWLDETLA